MANRTNRAALILTGVLLLEAVSPSATLLGAKGTRTEARGLRGAVAAGSSPGSRRGHGDLPPGGQCRGFGVAMILAASVVEFNSFGFGARCPPSSIPPGEAGRLSERKHPLPPCGQHRMVPQAGIQVDSGDGFMPAGVCAVLAAVVLSLDRYGTLSFSQIVQGAIRLADGFPVDERLAPWRRPQGDREISGAKTFRREWPSSGAAFLHDGRVPEVGEVTRLPDLARTFRGWPQPRRER